MINLRYSRVHLAVFIVLIGFSVLGLWIRLLPMYYMLSLGQPVVLYEDPWYTVRQVEQIVTHFPEYSWFDPMLAFPYGKVVDWGPVFPLFVSLFAVSMGATTQGEIIQTINWAPVLLGLVLIPLTYLLGRLIWDSRAGWISAMLICVVGGETLYRSFYGDVDHHIMEVVLTSAFFGCYFYLLSYLSAGSIKKIIVPLHVAFSDLNVQGKENTFFIRKEFLIALCAGILYYLAIMTMPTCTIIAIIVALITFLLPVLIQGNDQMLGLLQINGMIFGLFIVLFMVSGVHVSGFSFSQYTAVHLLIPLFILTESCIFYLVSWRFTHPKPLVFLIGIATFFAILCVFVFLYVPDIVNSLYNTFYGYFWGSETAYLIQEMNRADLGHILRIYNIVALLAVYGFVLIGLRLIKGRNPVHLAAFIWISVYIGISLLAVRYFYYGGHILVLLAGFCIADLYRRMQIPSGKESTPDIEDSLQIYISKNKKGLLFTGLLIALIMVLSVPALIALSSHDIPQSISEEWLESLQWLKTVSHNQEEMYYSHVSKDFFQYPETMFTVLSWWDYGNWILAIAHMSPATNPFQTNIQMVAKYLLSDNYVDAEETAEWLHIKYVITTNSYLFDYFPQIQKWLPVVPNNDPYYFVFYQQDSRTKQVLSPMLGMKPAFFNTTLVKLHVNDGSYMEANGSVVIQYHNSVIERKNIALLQNMYPLDKTQIIQFISQPRSNQEIISLRYTSPVFDTPALQNYRLIYESNGTRTFPGDVTLNNIKIFERVKGYTIPGTGTIEVPIVTNQGRHFMYRQQSVNGTFTLPYATKNSPYDVQATGPYRIIETNKTFDVDESQIEKYYT